MGERIDWTKWKDAIVVADRAEGATWDAIATKLGISRYAVVCRGRFIGAHVKRIRRDGPTERPPANPSNREAMPPGHPVSWGAITRGTWLDGAEYRYQPPKVGGKPVAAQLVEMAMRDAA